MGKLTGFWTVSAMNREEIFKLRQITKTAEEQEAEKQLLFELPRKLCEQMAPEIKRMDAKAEKGTREEKNEIQHRWHILKKILKRAKVRQIDQNVLPYLIEGHLDQSSRVVPPGEVSKRIYEEIIKDRDFDLYGNIHNTVKQHPRKHLELRYLAQQLNIMYTQQIDPTVIIEKPVDENEERRKRRLRIPRLKTDIWKIGYKPNTYGPVGFQNNVIEASNSLGNEQFFSYDGHWKEGKMHGQGVYLFEDGKTYHGGWVDNRPHGKGISYYPDGQTYEGEWVRGTYQGNGKTTSKSGIIYEGQFYAGDRNGHGKIIYPSGMVYEGDFFNGKPHGRGIITSKLSGWSYDGNFDKGSIYGSGILISPPPNSERITYFWSGTKEQITLPKLVRHYLREKEELRLQEERNKLEMYGPLRGLHMKDYVASIRSAFYNERIQEKKQKIDESLQKTREQKAKLYEARLKALGGET